MVLDIREYRRLKGGSPDLKAFLRSGPVFDLPEVDRTDDLARAVDLE